MSYKQIVPVKKGSGYAAKYPYVWFTNKMLMISNDAMILWGDTDYIRISINLKECVLILSKAEEAPDSYKLSHVCETKYARRIETNNALLSIIQAGFPLYMMRKRLPVRVLADGSLEVDFSYKVPVKEPIAV